MPSSCSSLDSIPSWRGLRPDADDLEDRDLGFGFCRAERYPAGVTEPSSHSETRNPSHQGDPHAAARSPSPDRDAPNAGEHAEPSNRFEIQRLIDEDLSRLGDFGAEPVDRDPENDEADIADANIRADANEEANFHTEDSDLEMEDLIFEPHRAERIARENAAKEAKKAGIVVDRVAENQWKVYSTKTTKERLVSLKYSCGVSPKVTFVVPGPDERPWDAPPGFFCVYESFFLDCHLRFPIPSLPLEYCERRGMALTQLTHGAMRHMVAMMMLAAENDLPLTCRYYEEMTSLRASSADSSLGCFYTQIRPLYNIITGPPTKSKIHAWRDHYFFVKKNEFAVADPRIDTRTQWSESIGTLFYVRILLFRRGD